MVRDASELVFGYFKGKGMDLNEILDKDCGNDYWSRKKREEQRKKSKSKEKRRSDMTDEQVDTQASRLL